MCLKSSLVWFIELPFVNLIPRTRSNVGIRTGVVSFGNIIITMQRDQAVTYSILICSVTDLIPVDEV